MVYRFRTAKKMFAATYIRIIFLSILSLPGGAFAQNDFKKDIDQILKSANGKIGVAIKNIETGEKFSFNDDHRYPMQSTFKFPLGMAILDLVDKGKLNLDQKIHVSREELQVKTWSPLREKFPEGNIDVSLAELLTYTVSQSDNITCDILFKLAGGPAAVDKYVHSLGVKDIAIVADEAKMATDWNIQFTNWCQPHTMSQLLEILHDGKKLSKSSNDFLLKLMTESPTGPKQIKGLLPKGTIVAHKTGASSTNEKGLTAAMNDLGIITLPNGKQVIVVVFITNSMDSKDVRDEQIARIAKTSYEYFLAR